MLAVEVSDHAIRRYGERVKPGLGPEALEAEVLEVLRAHAVITDRRPAWVADNEEAGKASAWACVGDGIVFMLAQPSRNTYVAVTCVARGGVSEEARERCNERAARRRRSRAARRRKSYVPRPVTRSA